MQARVVALGGLGLAAALGLVMLQWPPAPTPAAGVADSAAAAVAVRAPAVSWPTPATATPAAVPTPMSLLPSPGARAGVVGVPITVTAPQQLLVGELHELVVGLGANAGVSEIAFSVQFDANLLQVRAGSEGGWARAAGAQARFSAEIADSEDRVQIRSAVFAQRVGTAGGSVAIVQFQAMAPGSTAVTIGDIVVKDWAGRAIVSATSATNLQITVDSLPPVQTDLRR